MLILHKGHATTLILAILHWILRTSALELKRISVLEVQSVEGDAASMPCDIKHPPNDSVFLVLWFNDNLTTPIYSYDVRPAVRDSVSHWKDTSVLGDRATLLVSERVAELRISPVQERDEGFYKCRVDFRQHPTRTTRISLKVAVAPNSLIITQDGAQVTSVIGPFQDGDVTSLKCSAFGGRPLPRVYWYLGNRIIDDEMESDPEGGGENPSQGTLSDRQSRSLPMWKLRKSQRVSNVLSLGPLGREDLKKLLTCEASNTNISSPVSVAVMIDMNLPPLGVHISGPTEPVSSGRRYTLVCEVTGSRPPPSITWFKGSTRVQGETEVTSTDGNVTKSSVTLVPLPPDDGTAVTCRARNPATDTTLQSSLALSVNFVPEAVVKLASFLDRDNIKEGDDVYFECGISANPKVYKISWHHNGRILEPNITAGVIESNQSLVIQKVRRQHAGMYSCTASNIEGDGAASSVTLDIKYSPVCDPDQLITYGVAKKEDAEVGCRVNANPPARSFKWTFNNTADTIDVPPGRYTITPHSSIITYTPVTELDFGTLLCWAANNIGVQAVPCVFHIIPAGRPDPPTNCSSVNKTSVSFGVSCQSGFDGGLHQVFLIRVSRAGGRAFNYTNGEPHFMITNLIPGNSYRLQIWAANDKGSSVPVHMNAFTLNSQPHNPSHGPSEAEVREGNVGSTGPPEAAHENLSNDKMKAEIQTEWHYYGFIPAIVGCVVMAALIVLATSLLIRFKVRKRPARNIDCQKGEPPPRAGCHPQPTSVPPHHRHSEAGACDKREIQARNFGANQERWAFPGGVVPGGVATVYATLGSRGRAPKNPRNRSSLETQFTGSIIPPLAPLAASGTPFTGSIIPPPPPLAASGTPFNIPRKDIRFNTTPTCATREDSARNDPDAKKRESSV